MLGELNGDDVDVAAAAAVAVAVVVVVATAAILPSVNKFFVNLEGDLADDDDGDDGSESRPLPAATGERG